MVIRYSSWNEGINKLKWRKKNCGKEFLSENVFFWRGKVKCYPTKTCVLLLFSSQSKRGTKWKINDAVIYFSYKPVKKIDEPVIWIVCALLHSIVSALRAFWAEFCTNKYHFQPDDKFISIVCLRVAASLTLFFLHSSHVNSPILKYFQPPCQRSNLAAKFFF